MKRLRLHLLVAAGSTAVLACATSSNSASDAPPPDHQPSPAATTVPTTHDHHGHDPAWFWGEPTETTRVGEEHCYTSAHLAVLVGVSRVQYDAADRAPGCVMGATAKSVEVESEQSFRGVVGTHVLISEDVGSDIYNLVVYDGSGSEVFRATDVPPQSETRVDVANRQLIVGFGIGFSDDCTEGKTTYAEQERACWAEVRQQHPVLKDTAAPGCDCGPGGLWPFPILHKTVSLDAPSEPAVETLPLICGCSS